MLTIGIALAIVGVVTGLVAGLISRPPYGVLGDVAICVVIMVGLGLAEWVVLPKIGFTGWIRLAGTFGDPLGLSIIVLWLLRRSKR